MGREQDRSMVDAGFSRLVRRKITHRLILAALNTVRVVGAGTGIVVHLTTLFHCSRIIPNAVCGRASGRRSERSSP